MLFVLLGSFVLFRFAVDIAKGFIFEILGFDVGVLMNGLDVRAFSGFRLWHFIGNWL